MNLWVKWKGDKAARKLSVQVNGWVGFCGGRILSTYNNDWGWGYNPGQKADPKCGTQKRPLDELATLKAIVDRSNTTGALVIADRIGRREGIQREGVLGARFYDAIPAKFETKKYECEAKKLEFTNRNHGSKVFAVLISTKTKPISKKKKENVDEA